MSLVQLITANLHVIAVTLKSKKYLVKSELEVRRML